MEKKAISLDELENLIEKDEVLELRPNGEIVIKSKDPETPEILTHKKDLGESY